MLKNKFLKFCIFFFIFIFYYKYCQNNLNTKKVNIYFDNTLNNNAKKDIIKTIYYTKNLSCQNLYSLLKDKYNIIKNIYIYKSNPKVNKINIICYKPELIIKNKENFYLLTENNKINNTYDFTQESFNNLYEINIIKSNFENDILNELILIKEINILDNYILFFYAKNKIILKNKNKNLNLIIAINKDLEKIYKKILLAEKIYNTKIKNNRNNNNYIQIDLRFNNIIVYKINKKLKGE